MLPAHDVWRSTWLTTLTSLKSIDVFLAVKGHEIGECLAPEEADIDGPMTVDAAQEGAHQDGLPACHVVQDPFARIAVGVVGRG